MACVYICPLNSACTRQFEIEVTLPHCSRQLKLEAAIRNRRSFAYGVDFINITAAQQNRIEFICRSLALLQ